MFNCFVSANSRKLVSQFLIRLLASYPIVSISAFHILSTCQHLVQLLLSNLPVSTSACYYVILLLLSYHFGRIFFACQELTRLLVSTRYYRNFYLVSTALVSSCELDTFLSFLQYRFISILPACYYFIYSLAFDKNLLGY